MKKTIAFLVALVGVSAMAQTTPNIGLNLPVYSSPNWNVPLNQNFTILDNYLGGVNAFPNPLKASITGVAAGNLPLTGGTLTGSLTQTAHSAFGANAMVNTLPPDLGDGAVIPASTVMIVNEASTSVNGVNGFLDEVDWSPNGTAGILSPMTFSSDLNMNLDNDSGITAASVTLLGSQIVLTNNSNTVVAPETEALLISMNNAGNANINGAHVVEASYTNYGTSTNGADDFKASVQIPSGGGQMASWTGFRILAPVLGGSNGVTVVTGFSVPVCQITGVGTCHPWESLETSGSSYFAGPVIVNGLDVGSEGSPTVIITSAGIVEAGGGSNTVYRCTNSGGTLPTGTLTITSGDCGTSTAVALKVN